VVQGRKRQGASGRPDPPRRDAQRSERRLATLTTSETRALETRALERRSQRSVKRANRDSPRGSAVPASPRRVMRVISAPKRPTTRGRGEEESGASRVRFIRPVAVLASRHGPPMGGGAEAGGRTEGGPRRGAHARLTEVRGSRGSGFMAPVDGVGCSHGPRLLLIIRAPRGRDHYDQRLLTEGLIT
jgi:hypothetical protein